MFLDKSKVTMVTKFIAGFVAAAFVITLLPLVGNIFQNQTPTANPANPTDPLTLEINSLEGKVKSDPTDSKSWLTLGQRYLSLTQNQKAIDAFKQVSSIDASNADAYYYLGITYRNTVQSADAIAAFEKYAALTTSDADKAIAVRYIDEIKNPPTTTTTSLAATGDKGSATTK